MLRGKIWLKNSFLHNFTLHFDFKNKSSLWEKSITSEKNFSGISTAHSKEVQQTSATTIFLGGITAHEVDKTWPAATESVLKNQAKRFSFKEHND